MVLRIGLDLAWYRSGYGSKHGVAKDGASVYQYLTHGWQNNGGKADGTVPNGFGVGTGTGGGGFFTCYAYELGQPPVNVQGPAYNHDRDWILQFINAANIDAGGQRAKILLKFIALCNFDSTLVGTIYDFLAHLGTADKNPAVAGFGFRGAEEGINTGGTTGNCLGGSNGAKFVSSEVVFGPTGMNSWPQSVGSGAANDYNVMWKKMADPIHAYGYKLGVSTGLSNMDTYKALPKNYCDTLAEWFIQGDTIQPEVQPYPSASYTANYNTFYGTMVKPARAPSVNLGSVFGEWDPNWFIEHYNQSGYNVTLDGLQSSLQGAGAGYAALKTAADRWWMIYGEPTLLNDGGTVAKPQSFTCDYMPTLMKYATLYGFFTDFNTAPAPVVIPPITPPAAPALRPSCTQIHILGDAALDALKPNYSQTDPVYCCGADTYTLDGTLLDTAMATGLPNKPITILMFDYTQCAWVPLTQVTTNSKGAWGPITVKSPALPGTTRNQAYFYPAFLGDASYMPSNGTLEDLVILPSGTTATKLTITVKQL